VSIYTRRGDAGETDLFGGPRVTKDHRRVEAYGAVDELNAALGVCIANTGHADLRELSHAIQVHLMELGSTLATPDPERRRKSDVREVGADDVTALETHIDQLGGEVDPLDHFILPGGTLAAAAFQVARTVCRRAERRAVLLDREEPLPESALRYLNRLSDLLFVLARVENHRSGVSEVAWKRGQR